MSDNKSELSKELDQIGKGLEGISQVAGLANDSLADFIDTLGTLVTAASELQGTFAVLHKWAGDFSKKIVDSKPIESFSQSVTTNVEKIGESFSGLSNRTTSVKKILGSFCDSGREKLVVYCRE